MSDGAVGAAVASDRLEDPTADRRRPRRRGAARLVAGDKVARRHDRAPRVEEHDFASTAHELGSRLRSGVGEAEGEGSERASGRLRFAWSSLQARDRGGW